MIREFRIGKHTILMDLEPEQFVSDANLLWYAQNKQVPEPEVIHVMLRALKAGDCAVDAGANIGFFTALMSKIVGPHGTIMAIEPDKRNLAKLRKTLDINSCRNVSIIACALADRSALAGLYYDGDNGQSSLYGSADAQETVSTIALDDILNGDVPFGIGRGRPRLLKMDIEGSEVAALQGCTFDFPCIVTEVNEKALQRAGTSSKDLFRLMRERGYRRYQLHVDGSMPSHVDSYQEVKLTRDNANMLFAPRDLVSKNLWPEVEI